MAINNPDDLLKISDLPSEMVEFGDVGRVRVRALRASEKVALDRGKDDLTAAESLEVMVDVIIAGTVDSDGNPLFKDRERWVPWLLDRNEKTLGRVFDAIMRLSGDQSEKKLDPIADIRAPTGDGDGASGREFHVVGDERG